MLGTPNCVFVMRNILLTKSLLQAHSDLICVTCHMSICHRYFFYYFFLVKLVGEGYVINGAYHNWF